MTLSNFLLSLQRKNMEENIMASTMTLTVNLNRAGAHDFVDYARKLSFVKVVEPQVDPLVKEIARSYAGVKNGKIKTRPIEELLKEL